MQNLSSKISSASLSLDSVSTRPPSSKRQNEGIKTTAAGWATAKPAAREFKPSCCRATVVRHSGDGMRHKETLLQLARAPRAPQSDFFHARDRWSQSCGTVVVCRSLFADRSAVSAWHELGICCSVFSEWASIKSLLLLRDQGFKFVSVVGHALLPAWLEVRWLAFEETR